MAAELGVNIRIAHYPPYCSKYNPIEHRLFPHVSKAIRGANYTSPQMLATAIARTKTNTGVRTIVKINHKTYQGGKQYEQDYKTKMNIKFDKLLPQWNYTTARA